MFLEDPRSTVRSEKTQEEYVVFIRKFCTRFSYFGERRKEWILYWQVDKITLHHAVCQHEIGRKGVLLPIHHAATIALATTKHSKTFQRLLSIGRRIILLGVFQG